MAVNDVETQKKISSIEKVINLLDKRIVQQQKQISSLIAKNRNLELQVNHLTKLINRDRD